MWLIWSFEAEVRGWIAALLFPAGWRAGKSRSFIAGKSSEGFTTWLVQDSFAPLFVCQLMTCQRCWSAHIAGVGTLCVALAQILPLPLLPLVWAGGATIGNLIYDNRNRA